MKQNEISKTTTMIKLYEESKNFCPKYRIIKTETTIHCIICDKCVRNFDLKDFNDLQNENLHN